jgi:divalent metal cation (Fe/Co/Zn/Cd) transporter
MFSLYEGVHKFLHPTPLSYPWVAIGVLLFAIVAESISLWGCLREVNKERYGRSIVHWFKQSRSSALIVVFGEDIAALLGLVLALVAIVATLITGDPIWDALGTISIGVLLIVVAFFVAVEVKDLLIGQSVDPAARDQMQLFLEGHEAIEKVYNVLTMQFGPDAMVAVKARLVLTGSEAGLVSTINQIEGEFKSRFPSTTWLFFEPDVHD